MVTVEQLYKKFGVLADAKDKAGEVTNNYLLTYSTTFLQRWILKLKWVGYRRFWCFRAWGRICQYFNMSFMLETDAAFMLQCQKCQNLLIESCVCLCVGCGLTPKVSVMCASELNQSRVFQISNRLFERHWPKQSIVSKYFVFKAIIQDIAGTAFRAKSGENSPKIFSLRPIWPEKWNKSRPKSQCKSLTCIFHNSIKLPGVGFNCVIWHN